MATQDKKKKHLTLFFNNYATKKGDNKMELKLKDLATSITLNGTKYLLCFNGGTWYTYRDFDTNIGYAGINTNGKGKIKTIEIYSDSEKCNNLKDYINFILALKNTHKDFSSIQTIITNNNNDFDTLCKIFNGYNKEEKRFDFAFGNYAIYTYHKRKGLDTENIEIWFDNGFWNSYSLNEIIKILKNKGTDYWQLFNKQSI